MNIQRVSCEFGGKPLFIETGKMAKQADGSVLVGYGDSRVLVTVCSSYDPKPGADFFPLTVEFSERFYAAGRIPGSFFKREGRPTMEATLAARMIDRPIRPLFPEGYFHDTQIVAMIMSYDKEADVEVAASIGASAALHISDIPFGGPTAACRIGRIGGKLIVNPPHDTILNRENELEILIAGSAKAITMVEGGAREVPEEEMLEAVMEGHRQIKMVCSLIDELRIKTGSKPKRTFTPPTPDKSLVQEIETLAKSNLEKALRTKEKAARYDLVGETKKATVKALVTDEMKKKDKEAATAKEAEVKRLFELLQYNLMREMILSEKSRIDGRDLKTIRPITVEAGILPRTHGSALFTRGETQVLSTITLGTSDDEQIVDTIWQNAMRKFMLHYNFPPFSVGETGRMGGQSRREIGHGALAERSVREILPAYEKFPYTLRIVCETLESNGSSSMGSVCSASMALMDAGIPVSAPVAGIAMGLIKEGDRVAVLSDILGDEDHLGDMDFKVAGTSKGVTGIQMDIKIEGVDEAIMRTALTQAREGRLHILSEMAKGISAPRQDLSLLAPRITTITVPVDKIREVIGSGGKVVRDIVARTGCKIDINDDGKINIASNDGAAAQMAIDIIQGIVAVPELGKVYNGVVKKVVEFGAFVAVMPNTEGLLHVSEIAHERVRAVSDYLKEGDEVEVKVIDIDSTSGKIRLSRKVLLAAPEGQTSGGGGSSGGGRTPQPPRGNQPPRTGGPRPTITPVRDDQH